MDDDLSLVDSDDLIKELERRFDTMIFSGAIERSDQQRLEHFHHNGDTHVAVGLANVLAARITLDWIASAPNAEDTSNET